jgi:hypothetical protein
MALCLTFTSKRRWDLSSPPSDSLLKLLLHFLMFILDYPSSQLVRKVMFTISHHWSSATDLAEKEV